MIPLDGVNESVLPIIGSELKKLETYLKKKQTEVKALDPEDAKKAAEKRLEMKRERLKSEKYIDEQIDKVMKEKEIWDSQEKGWKKFKAGMKAVFNDLEGQCSVIEKAEEERKKAELAAGVLSEDAAALSKFGESDLRALLAPLPMTKDLSQAS